ncbi:ZRT3 [Candida theae]|uniref:ZRT3 n=1 Tax=Candida theae TaxID=1198502 RepID=A0AAD5BED5_9ASCO|nr:ZRT3 [Candida theae]KAI5957605.1 ZRT3 [Candida theae]
MFESLQFLTQGWILTILSSSLCVLGTLIIYFDDLYYLIFPKFITSRYKFQLKENYSFLNGSLALSSGCLILTALYRLLPEASKYLSMSNQEANAEYLTKRWQQIYLMSSYFGGILICASFNFALHLLTSESVVHCNHGNTVKEEQDHGMREVGHNHSHSHQHSHANFEADANSAKSSNNRDENAVQDFVVDERPVEVQVHETETTPLIRATVKSKKSFIQLFLNDEVAGECKGYTSAELCTYHHHEHERGKDRLHFCEIPQLRREEEDQEEEEEGEDSRGHSHSHSHSHPHSHSHSHSHSQDGSRTPHREPTLYSNQSHHSHEVDHHHHVNSPLSRLFLIGVETALAITLHKLPEGFITYVTSETNPKLGFSIFVSLILHNYTEGFSMCLPLFYAMSTTKYAKLKAVSISALLGGISQPLGALLGYVFLKINSHKYDLQALHFIFGITMAVTSGFLTVVALTMFGSAVAFGGNMNFVISWCIVGIMLIGLSTVFSS